MITLGQALQGIIKRTPFLEEGLATGIINLSALARTLKPRLEKRLYKRFSEAAVVMALKRINPNIKGKYNAGSKELSKFRNLTVRSNLVEYIFHNYPGIASLQRQLLRQVETDKNGFLNFSQGIYESTIIISSSLKNKIQRNIPKEFLIKKITGLSAVTLSLQKESVYVVGVYYPLFKALAWENINLIEAVSNYSEISLIVADKDIDQAFSAIKSLTKPE